MTRQVLERVANVLAGLACIVFVLGLADSPRVVVQAISARAVPEVGAVRDARVQVSVVSRKGAPVDDATVTVFWEHDDNQHSPARPSPTLRERRPSRIFRVVQRLGPQVGSHRIALRQHAELLATRLAL